MSPYFCWSLLSLSLKTAGMKSDSLSNSAMMAFPLDTILRMAWPHRLFSARKSTMMRKKTADLFSDHSVSPQWWPDLKTFNKKALLFYTDHLIVCLRYRLRWFYITLTSNYFFLIIYFKNTLLFIAQSALKRHALNIVNYKVMHCNSQIHIYTFICLYYVFDFRFWSLTLCSTDHTSCLQITWVSRGELIGRSAQRWGLNGCVLVNCFKIKVSQMTFKHF